MKLLLTNILAAAVFVMLSCGTVDNSRKYPNMVADADPISAGTIEAQIDRFFSANLNKIVIEVIFYPRLNSVALEFRHEFITYRQFWDLLGRQQFASALELYKKDYAERNLTGKHRKTRSVYGKVKGRAEWESFQFAATHLAYPVIELGYRFKMDAPFFVTFMRSTKEEAMSGSDSSTRGESQQISMYFTRSQADELVKLFDQAFLMGLLDNRLPDTEDSFKFFDFSIFNRKDTPRPSKQVDADSYQDVGE
ncbi:MAG: hypothetical protein FWC24_06660 [Treponema sp.]|nr:hypothetical protein [Treponema sp.]